MIERGQPLPDWYGDEPYVDPADRFVLDGFWRLSTCRPLGMGFIGPIPDDKIQEYADRKHMPQDVRDLFEACVREMDAGYLAFQQGEAERNKKPPAPTAPSPTETPTLGRHSRRRR